MDARPIQRMESLYSERDFNLYNDCLKQYLEMTNDHIYYYRVNRDASDVDDLYGEGQASEVILEAPIELLGVFRYIGEQEQKTYLENSTLAYDEDANVEVDLLKSCVDELNIQICKGDFFAYRLDETCPIFYEIYQDGSNLNSANNKLNGYKPNSITIKGKPVDGNTITRL